MNNPVIIGYLQTDRPDYNPQKDPRPANWDSNMPPVDPHMVKVEDFEDEIRLIFPGIEFWLKKSDLVSYIED